MADHRDLRGEQHDDRGGERENGRRGVPGYDGTGHRGGQDSFCPVQGTEDQPADT